MKRRIGSLLLLCLLCACLCTQALAVSPQSCAEELSAIDVFRGTDTGFELDRAPKRSEAAVMLVRLYGAEEEALSLYEAGLIAHPFEDVSGWAAPYLAWLYSEGLVRGVSETRYGADAPCRARDYALFLLRALGYQDGADFAWAETEDFAEACGFYSRALFGGTFTRGDLALMTWLALQCPSADGSGTLLAGLTARGAIEQDAARTLEASFRKSPVHVKDGTVRTDELDALVSGWAGQYGTYNTPYRFDSYVKGVTPIDFIPCDYRIDEAGVKKQLLQAICAMEPCTITAGLTCYRWGAPFDISLTHVEVDLDNQQLTFIKNGTVIVNTNIVTGMVGSHRTPIGLYEAHNKQTNCTLTGADYEVFVKYWVSVIGDSIGLHDASWRSVFGGDQYIFNGSHGCINIPEAAMVKIFNNIEDGTPVLIFGQNKWYQPGSADSPATKNPLRGTTARQ